MAFQPQHTFNDLNLEKVSKWLKLSLAIFVGIFLTLLSAYNYLDNPIGVFNSAIILFGYAMLSDFIFFFLYHIWKKNKKNRISIFNSDAFDGISEKEMENEIIFKNTKGKFVEETLKIHIAPFDIICNPNEENKDLIDFNFQALIRIRKENVENIISFYNENQIDIYSLNQITGVSKTLSVQQKSSTELSEELKRTAALLHQNGFEPFDRWDESEGSAIYITGE